MTAPTIESSLGEGLLENGFPISSTRTLITSTPHKTYIPAASSPVMAGSRSRAITGVVLLLYVGLLLISGTAFVPEPGAGPGLIAALGVVVTGGHAAFAGRLRELGYTVAVVFVGLFALSVGNGLLTMLELSRRPVSAAVPPLAGGIGYAVAVGGAYALSTRIAAYTPHGSATTEERSRQL